MSRKEGQKVKRLQVGVVGYGFVGKAIEAGFNKKSDVYINDIALDDSVPIQTLVEKCEIIFISVPTPFSLSQEKCNTFAVKSVLKSINEAAMDVPKYQIAVIKSAVPPMDVREFIKLFPYVRIIVSPEYLSERDPIRDFINQEALILGGDREDCQIVIEAFREYSICNKNANVGVCTAEEASLLKYMENTFLAMKVIFMNEFQDVYIKMKIGNKKGFNDLLKIHHYDKRMWYQYPYQIPGPDGNYGFGGKCLPKDLLTIVHQAKQNGVKMNLLEKTWELNLKYREDRNWLEIKGGVER